MEGNERLTDGELAEIRKQSERALKSISHDEFADEAFDIIEKDVPKLLAEIERLRTDQERLISELKKADKISEELERKYMAAKWPEVMADINEYVAKMRRERDD